MPRFVVLEHDHPQLHWDFMLEHDGVLWTWRLAEPPLPGHAPLKAIRLGNHRLAYLDYEGPISGGRGTVKRWDRGVFTWQAEPLEDAPVYRMEFDGQRLRGQRQLTQGPQGEWRLSEGR